MRTKQELATIATHALAYVTSQPDVVEAEVFVASNGLNFGRINYTSHILCNGLEEPKDEQIEGITVTVVFRGKDDTIEVGEGSETGTLTESSVKKAFAKARDSRIHDSEFVSLPRPSKEQRTLFSYHDEELIQLSPEGFVDASWRIIAGAVDAARTSPELLKLVGGEEHIQEAHLIVNGDLTILQERIAVCSTAMPNVQTDESTLAMAYVTAMVENVTVDGEKTESKGSGYGTWVKLADIDGSPGKAAMEHAIASIGGTRIPKGKYTVIFAPAAVASMMDTILESLTAYSLYAGTSLFSEKLGEKVATDGIELYDLGNQQGLVASKGITCEGLPTGRTNLIKDGRFVGTLCTWYASQRICRDPHAEEKLGKKPNEWAHAFVSRNGFRFHGPGRTPGSTSALATNVILESSRPTPLDKMIASVEDGVLLGRLWYVYPMGPPSQGDFTGTAVADSFLIKDGKIAGGLAINSIRINDNYRRVLMGIEAVSEERETPLIWAADSVRHMPYVLVKDVPLSTVSGPIREVEK